MVCKAGPILVMLVVGLGEVEAPTGVVGLVLVGEAVLEAVVAETDPPIVEYEDAEFFWASLTDYDAQIRSIFATENIITEALRVFPAQHGTAVADLGCGVGRSFRHLRSFRVVYAVDNSKNMINKAMEQQEANVVLMEGRIEDVALPERCGLVLALGSVMPENNDHFHVMMENIVRNTADDGVIMLYVPSMESRTFAFQKHVDMMIDEGRTQEEIVDTTRANILRYQFNPLGYMLTDSSLLQKQWLKEEIEYRLARYCFQSICVEKFELDWDKQVNLPQYGHYPPHWNWFVTLRR